MKLSNRLVWAILYIALGLMFIVLKGSIVSIALTVTGSAAIVMGIIDFSNKNTPAGTAKTVGGACIIIFGWMFVSLALNLLAGILIVSGLFHLYQLRKGPWAVSSSVQKAFLYLEPIASVLAGITLLFNQAGSIAWIFTVTGILLVVEGILLLSKGEINSYETIP